jgi:hypothetical protein
MYPYRHGDKADAAAAEVVEEDEEDEAEANVLCWYFLAGLHNAWMCYYGLKHTERDKNV